MTITTTTLSKAAGAAAVVSGLIFIGVQVNHPHMEVESVGTTEWAVRFGLKVLMAALGLAGIAGMYLRQVRQTGVTGLVGWLLLSGAYLAMMTIAFAGGFVLPSIAETSPAYVDDVLAATSGGTASGDIGLLTAANGFSGITYIGGGLVFGIALWRAGVLARWAAALLAVSTVSTLLMPLMPHMVDRLLAWPFSVAMIGLGVSLYRVASAPAAAFESQRVPVGA